MAQKNYPQLAVISTTAFWNKNIYRYDVNKILCVCVLIFFFFINQYDAAAMCRQMLHNRDIKETGFHENAL